MMSIAEDFDAKLGLYHAALNEFTQGHPEPVKSRLSQTGLRNRSHAPLVI